MGAMWNTKQMQEDLDREVFVKTTIRELAVYLIFIYFVFIRDIASKQRLGASVHAC